MNLDNTDECINDDAKNLQKSPRTSQSIKSHAILNRSSKQISSKGEPDEHHVINGHTNSQVSSLYYAYALSSGVITPSFSENIISEHFTEDEVNQRNSANQFSPIVNYSLSTTKKNLLCTSNNLHNSSQMFNQNTYN